MPLSAAYASYPDYLARWPDKPGRDQSKVDRALLGFSRIIEGRAGQFFNIDSAVVDRIFWGDGSAKLRIQGNGSGNELVPGIATATGLVVAIDSNNDGTYATTLSASDYEKHPLNAALNPEAEPWRWLEIPSWSTASLTYFPSGYRVKVTAKFGWYTVPGNIRNACVELAAILLGDSPLATRQYTEYGAVGASAEGRSVLEDMVDRYSFQVVA